MAKKWARYWEIRFSQQANPPGGRRNPPMGAKPGRIRRSRKYHLVAVSILVSHRRTKTRANHRREIRRYHTLQIQRNTRRYQAKNMQPGRIRRIRGRGSLQIPPKGKRIRNPTNRKNLHRHRGSRRREPEHHPGKGKDAPQRGTTGRISFGKVDRAAQYASQQRGKEEIRQIRTRRRKRGGDGCI